MSKKSIFLLIFTLILSLTLQSGTYAEKDTAESITEKSTAENNTAKEGDFPTLHTDYYLLADLKSGKILESKNGDEKVYPASTTKILTAVLTLENCNLEDVVTATSEAIDPINRNHSNMGILVGEELTVEQLLYGLLVASANDAANVLGIHISGNLESFADLMNEKAKELGAENTQFTNAHGFHDDNHYTTVNDIAKIACFAMQNEKFREIVATAKYQIPPTNKYKDTRYFSNTNMLISSNKTTAHIYKNAIGIKTGSTDEAGNCLVAAAESNGTELLSIVMQCKNENLTDKAYSFIDSRALLEYGFSKYEYKTIASVSDVVESSKVREAKDGVRVSISPAEDISALLPKDADLSLLEIVAEKNDDIDAPIKKGDVLGKITYKLEDEVLGTTNLVAGNDVERDVMLYIIYGVWDIVSDPVIIIGVLLLVILILYARSANKRKRRAQRRNLRRAEFEDLPETKRKK